MTDIVERLRYRGGLLVEEAADEIERLRKVLQEIADMRYDNTSAARIADSAVRQ